jgi:hypothetical protein
VHHERGAGGKQDDARHPVVDALPCNPQPATAGVITKEGCK